MQGSMSEMKRPPADGVPSSQAMDVGTLKNLQADTIRVLVWVLAFLSFGYATAEFEVTSERLGVYRPEEHIEYVGYPDMVYLLSADLLPVTPRIMPTTRMRASMTSACDLRFAR